MNPLVNPLVRLTFKNHRAKSEAQTALATAPLFLTLGLGLVVIETYFPDAAHEADNTSREDYS